MFISGGRYTSESSLKVATALHYAGAQPDRFIDLSTITYHQRDSNEGRDEVQENITIKIHPALQHVVLANDAQVIRCLTAGNKRCDIILAPPATRDIEPALVLIEAD